MLLLFYRKVKKRQDQHPVFDLDLGMNISKFVVEVECSNEFGVCSSREVKVKCILLCNNRSSLLIEMPKFETL